MLCFLLETTWQDKELTPPPLVILRNRRFRKRLFQGLSTGQPGIEAEFWRFWRYHRFDKRDIKELIETKVCEMTETRRKLMCVIYEFKDRFGDQDIFYVNSDDSSYDLRYRN